MKPSKPFAKITQEDYEIAAAFFENERHLDEFISNVFRYYFKKPLTIKTKNVKKYFETYKKTMNFIIDSKNFGKQSADNKEFKEYTLTGVLPSPTQDPCQQIVNSKEIIDNSKLKIENSKKETVNTKSELKNSQDSDDSVYPTFNDFWELYDKKVGEKEKTKKLFLKISQEGREKIMQHVSEYKIATPDKQYRKNPMTYLNNKSWNDEIIIRGANTVNRKENAVYDACMAIYNDFLLKKINQPAKIDKAEEDALIDIITHFENTPNVISGINTVEQCVKFIFDHWNRLDSFNSAHMTLTKISKNLIIILTQIKNGHGKQLEQQQQRDRTTDQLKRSMEDGYWATNQ